VIWPEKLAEDAIDRLLGDIEYESRGIQRNKGVREYFRQLPPGLNKQDYILRVDGSVRREVHIGPLNLATDLSEIPYLMEITGNVIGVGFDPGKYFVRIKSTDPSASEVTLMATSIQVDRALENRHERVRALVLSHVGGKKLLRLQLTSDVPMRLDIDGFVFRKWDALLARLAL